MEKINVAELLKDCPRGMELDCTMYDNCTFAGIEDVGYIDILIRTPSGIIRLTKEGCYIRHDDYAKCVIFPKGKTSWDGFHQRPFKDGDILTTNIGSIFIFSHLELDRTSDRNMCKAYVGIQDTIPISLFHTEQSDIFGPYESMCRFATAEEKEKLFQAIKDNGYKWNQETKNLEKLVVNDSKFKVGAKVLNKNGGIFEVIEILGSKNRYLCASCGAGIGVHQVYDEEELQVYEPMKPEFKVGDKIRRKGDTRLTSIKDIKDNYYIITIPDYFDNAYITDKLLFSNQNEYELVPDKFDITTLVPFESKVLARNNDREKWHPGIWGYYDPDCHDYPYRLIGDIARYCIPYEGNEHLLGTTNDCDEFYKTWK